MKNEIKDSMEFIGVNATGIVMSLTEIDALLRTLILVSTLVYSILKITRYIKENENKKK
tara:strand:- start:323 stop:499 length:177 start_codon:yes stop_codon:yes gene_type:complete